MYHHTHRLQHNKDVYCIFVPTSIVFLHLLLYIFNRKLDPISESVSVFIALLWIAVKQTIKKNILIKKFHYDTLELNRSFTVKPIFISPNVEFANIC